MKLLPMKTRFVLLALLWVPSNGQQVEDTSTVADLNATTVPNLESCDVCGEGGQVSVSGKFIGTSFGMFTCASLQGAGVVGNIDISNCAEAKTAAKEICGCTSPTGETEVPGGVEATEEPFLCNICSDGKIHTIQEGIVEIPNQKNRTCYEYLRAAQAGVLDERRCGILQQFTDDACGCVGTDVNSTGEVETTDVPDVPDESEVTDPPVEEPEPEPFECAPCGEGMMMTNFDGIVAIPNQPERTCAEIFTFTSNGAISENQCYFLQPFVAQSCRCAEAVEEATEEPVVYDCPICGEGMEVTTPDGIVEIPTQPNRTCTELLHANAIGHIDATQCRLLHPFTATPCGCMAVDRTTAPSPSPTNMPSSSPTYNTEPTTSPAPTGYSTVRPECFDNLAEIHEIEAILGESPDRRRYILCPDTTFNMGTLNEKGEIDNGEPFIMLRPNVIYQCGETGSRSNNCILKGGDFAVTSYYGVFADVYEAVENVKLIGLTFQSQNHMAAVLEAAGDISFIDCAFKMQANMVPVLIQWRGEGPVEASAYRKLRKETTRSAAQKFVGRRMEMTPSRAEIQEFLASRRLQMVEHEHKVTFQDCVFRENSVVSSMGFPGIIENTFGSELEIINCLFEDNVYSEVNNPGPFGYAVRSFGPLRIESTCFINNDFYKHGSVLVYASEHTERNNYVEAQRGIMTCEFLALFANKNDMSNEVPTCFEPDSDSCIVTHAPTNAPTREPRHKPSKNHKNEAEDSGAPSKSAMLTAVLAVAVASLL